MWYFKQTAKTLISASKNILSYVDSRTQIQKLIDQISSSEEQIIPTSKLNQLVSLTYNYEQFTQALQIIISKIKTFKYDLDQAKITLNLLISINYLIKHGASGFIDQLRQYVNTFKKYQLLKQMKVYQDEVLQKEFSYILEKIKSRARHIQVLLEDKVKLLKQKELAMLIKQKMKLYQTNSKIMQGKQQKNAINSLKGVNNLNNDNKAQRLQKQRQKQNKVQNNSNIKSNNGKKVKDYADKLDGFMQKYLWKYVDRIDDKIEVISEKILQNFDKYVLGQLPENFQPDSLEDEDGDDSRKNDKNKISKNQEVRLKQMKKQIQRNSSLLDNQNQNNDELNSEQKRNNNYTNIIDSDDDDLMRRLEQQCSVSENKQQNNIINQANLIDFAEVVDQNNSESNQSKNNQEQSLI